MGRLEGKTALVTGAASGIGLHTSIRLAEEGARVMMTDINLKEVRQQAEKLGANAAFLKLDITEEEEWISVLDETVKRFDRLDILVNSAGMVLIADVEEITLEDWRKVHAVNLDGTFLGCKHGVREGIRRGFHHQLVLGLRDDRRFQSRCLQFQQGSREDAYQIGRAALCKGRLRHTLQLDSPHLHRNSDARIDDPGFA